MVIINIKAKNKVGSKARAYYKEFKYPCLLRGSICTVKHYEDYDKPLYVLWLCRKCHSMLHKKKLNTVCTRLINNCYRWFYIDKWITYNWYMENKAVFPRKRNSVKV